MSLKLALLSFTLFAATALAQQSAPQSSTPGATPPTTQMYVEPTLPYTPSLDVTAMDRSADPCVDFYQYSCGGWQKNNPIPPDQTSWSVYGKLYEDNLGYLRAHSGAGGCGQGPRCRHPEDRRLLRRVHGREPRSRSCGAKPICSPTWSRSRASRTFARWRP